MIRVLLADDHTLVRQCLIELLKAQPDILVVAEAENGRTAVKLSRKILPDVVLMDISMPGLNGIEAIEQLKNLKPNTKIIVLSMYADTRLVKKALSAGACGYLTKDCDSEELIKAIHAAVCNRRYFSPVIIEEVIDDYVSLKPFYRETASVRLSQREKEILQLIAEGKTLKEIARELTLSSKTIEVYKLKIMNKVHVYSIAGLTKLAIREGLISFDIPPQRIPMM